MVRPPGLEPGREEKEVKNDACNPRPTFLSTLPARGATKTPDRAKEPRAPTAGRMKNRPGAAEPSGGALLSRARCRGTYPPPAAGSMKERKRRWRREKGQPPPAAFDGISITCFFGSKRSFFQQAEIFSHLHNQFTIPAQRGLFGNMDRIRRTENGV